MFTGMCGARAVLTARDRAPKTGSAQRALALCKEHAWRSAAKRALTIGDSWRNVKIDISIYFIHKEVLFGDVGFMVILSDDTS